MIISKTLNWYRGGQTLVRPWYTLSSCFCGLVTLVRPGGNLYTYACARVRKILHFSNHFNRKKPDQCDLFGKTVLYDVPKSDQECTICDKQWNINTIHEYQP